MFFNLLSILLIMNKINKKFSYPSEKPKGYINNLHTKDGGWLHSSNQLLLDKIL